MESFGDDPDWEAVDKRSAQGLIAALPVGNGMGKKGRIVHAEYYIIRRLYCQLKNIKTFCVDKRKWLSYGK